MNETGPAHDRELLLEAFRAGWQAALAVNVTHPRVLAVIESCFDGWLVEAADEVEVFGLAFRRREDLPRLVDLPTPRQRPRRGHEREFGREPGREHGETEPAPEATPVAAFEEHPLGGILSAWPAT